MLSERSAVNGAVTSNLNVGGGLDQSTSGQEVRFNIDFTDPVTLGAGHFFFRPEVELSDGTLLWLWASKTIGAPVDLQSWMRDDNLAPDWLRVGTDIVG